MNALINDRVRLSIDDAGVAEVALARPDKMNALDAPMFRAIENVMLRLRQQQGLRAVVLHGEGRAFCAGLDKSRFVSFADGGVDDLIPDIHARTHGLANLAQHLALGWREIPVPVIAALQGVVIGGGLQIALGADLRLAAPDTQFAVLEIQWGLVPDMAGLGLMRGLVRDDVARELVWTGRKVQAGEAVGIGLATRVCEAPLQEARQLAQAIAMRSPDAVRAAKRLCNRAQRSLDASAAEMLQAESAEQGALLGQRNQVEALLANTERRPPRFFD